MSVAQLRASRALWRRREVWNYRQWHASKAADRSRYYKRYIECRDARRNRDRQLAHLLGGFHTVSDAGVAMVAQFEGFRPHIYRDIVGVRTIGYGETDPAILRKYAGGITEPEARSLLRDRLNKHYAPSVIAANKKLKQHEGDGFTSFTYNVGVGGVASSTAVGRFLRRGNVHGAADAILAWCKAGGRVIEGLRVRRVAERKLILS